MIIDINEVKSKNSCKNCRHSNGRGACKNTNYYDFIMDALHTGFCQGFEEKDGEKNGK